MSLSIITPHYNDFVGLQRVYNCLKNQSIHTWEWIIVDDMSDPKIKEAIEDLIKSLDDHRVKTVFNCNKTNASVCRNIGADLSSNNRIVFLDSDDEISSSFVAHRQIEFRDFAVFKNTAIIKENGDIQTLNASEENYLNCYLRARFLWPITAILWDKTFFYTIGEFRDQLLRLQDVELAIRGLQQSNAYTVIDNKVDFYYRVVPIRSRKNFVKPVCDSVYLFISELLDTSLLSEEQLRLLSGYYFLCIRYFERSGDTAQIDLVRKNLRFFYNKKYITFIAYALGLTSLKLYAWHLLSSEQFLKINRYLFKPKS